MLVCVYVRLCVRMGFVFCVCICVGFVMCGFVWFCNVCVCVCVCVNFVICGYVSFLMCVFLWLL